MHQPVKGTLGIWKFIGMGQSNVVKGVPLPNQRREQGVNGHELLFGHVEAGARFDQSGAIALIGFGHKV